MLRKSSFGFVNRTKTLIKQWNIFKIQEATVTSGKAHDRSQKAIRPSLVVTHVGGPGSYCRERRPIGHLWRQLSGLEGGVNHAIANRVEPARLSREGPMLD